MAHPYATSFIETTMPDANHHDRKWLANQLTKAIASTKDNCIDGVCVVADGPGAMKTLEASRTC
jgi:hypothetical protein